MRIRKNAAFMTNNEWTRYCNAIVTLKHTFPGGSSVSIYDQFVAIHLCVWGLLFGSGPAGGTDGAHNGPAFLPWHREYLRRYEEALAAVDPTVSLPYWNWGFGSDSETNDLFQDSRMGPRGGIITTGYFAETATAENPLGWSLHRDLRPFGSALRRTGSSNTSFLPTEAAVFEAMDKNTFSRFRPALENGAGLSSNHRAMHNGIHVWIGGDMMQMTSPNDPIFFMHHAQIDRIWDIWQRQHPGGANYNDANISVGNGHGLTDNMWPWDGGASTTGSTGSNPDPAVAAALVPTEANNDLVTPEDVLDTEILGYLYDGKDPAREFAMTGTGVTHQWSTTTLNADYGTKPAVLANMQTFAGDNTAAVRVRNASQDRLEFSVQEEQSSDNEIQHVAETIGYMVGNEGLIHDSSGRVIGELVTIRLGQPSRNQWEQANLSQNYTNPIVIAQISSFNGSQPAQIRLQAVNSNSFELQIEEWAYLDGQHIYEDVSYLVVESGRHRLQDGTILETGVTTVNQNWTTVGFGTAFDGTPIVLSQCMTRDGSDPVITRQRNISTTGFDVRLQEEEANATGPHVNETVGYVGLFR